MLDMLTAFTEIPHPSDDANCALRFASRVAEHDAREYKIFECVLSDMIHVVSCLVSHSLRNIIWRIAVVVSMMRLVVREGLPR
jgi:hypothetical protein